MTDADVARRLVTAWNRHDPDLLRGCYRPEAVIRPLGWTGETDPDTWRLAVPVLVSSFPDLALVVENTVTDGARVVLDIRMTGTNTGPLGLNDLDRIVLRTDATQVGPTGHAIDMRGVVWLELREGLVSSEVHHWPFAGMLQQLGLLPMPAAA